jgi:hypothetical protein
MITMLGSPRRCCDGLTRRETLKAGALSILGGLFHQQGLLALQSSGGIRPAKAKSVILLYLLGGAATQDMFDLKPNAPEGVRSEFKPAATSAPGIQICEHLPRMAHWMHRAAIVRSVNHKAGCHNCLPSYAGYEVPQPDQHPRDTHPPSMGSVCEYLNRGHSDFPAYVYMPCWLGWGQAFRRAGPYAGFLGKRFDPLTTECLPYRDKNAPAPRPGFPQVVGGEPVLPNSALGADLTIDRLDSRRGLLHQLDEQVRRAEAEHALDAYDRTQRRAFNKLPHLDLTYSALMEDLSTRGLLDETLVVLMSEMGRTPRVNANGGRDHWTYCYSVLLAGGGIRGGTVYGASDAQAAFVKDKPVSTSDICATIYQCLGIDPDMPVFDRSGRPTPVANGGGAIRDILV